MADYEEIPQGAIDLLKGSPETADQFNAVFGAGRAQDILEAANPTPEPQEDEADWTYAGETWRMLVGGTRDAAHETANFAQWIDTTVNDAVFGEGNVLTFEGVIPREDSQFAFGEGGRFELPEVAPNQTFVGQMGRGITQFTAGYLTAGGLTRLTGLKGAFINGAIADAVVFNPEDPNLTAFLGEYGVDMGVVSDVLATDPDDPEFINRLRNSAEGAIAGSVAEAIGWAVRARRARAVGNTEAEAEFNAKQTEALSEIDEAIAEASDAVRADIDETMRVSKDVLDPLDVDVEPQPARQADEAVTSNPEGQLELDLGDTPAPRPAPAAEANPRRIFMAPERVEKARLQARLAAGESIDAKTAGLSFRSLNTATDFEEVLDDIAGVRAVMADEFAQIKGGDIQRWATVKQQTAAKLREMAQMTNEDPETVIRRFMSADLGDIHQVAAEVHARSRYLLTVEKDIKRMARAIASGQFNPKEFPNIRDMDHLRLAFNQRREVGANLLAGQDALRSNVARAMNAMKMSVKGDEKLQQMLRDPALFRDIDATAKAVADPANAHVPALRVIDETLGKLHGFMDRVNSFRINALLSGVGTQEVNLISNLVNSLVIPTGQAVGSLTTGDLKMAKHAARQLQGSFMGLRDSVATALQAGWWDEAVLDPFSAKIEDDALRSSVTGVSSVDKVVTLPSRALMTMDEFFKQSQYRGVVFADASSEATAKGLKGDERTAFIKQYLADSYTPDGAAVRGDALLQARRSTFTEPLEAGLASAIQKAAIDYPLIRFFVPFVRTPINILSQTYQHAPVLGMASKRFRADIAAGGARAAQARGRQAIGLALTATAGYLASAGYITGSGPTDPRIRAAWLKNNQPYAFRVVQEDGSITWISYARLEPLSNVFSIAADAVEIMGDEYNEADTRNVILAMNMAVMENTVNKTFTQGIYDAMSLFVGRPHEQERALNNFVASFVPNILNQTNGDEALREARTLTDAIKARTGLYNEVDPRRNVLGEVVLRTLPKYDPLGLTEEDNREIDLVMEEITRVALLNDTVAGQPSRTVAGPNDIDLSKVPYSDTQSVYDRWIELTGTVEINGRTLREELERVIDSEDYRNTPDGFRGASTGTKASVIRRIISAYRNEARSQLPELTAIITSERRGGAMLMNEQAGRTSQPRQFLPEHNPPNLLPTQRRTFEELLGQ